MAYADLLTVQTLNAGDVLTAAAMQQVRANEEFFVDPPACSIFNSAAQSVANNTLTAMTADSELFDNDSMHSTSVNTSRQAIQTAGRYLLVATLSFAGDIDGPRYGSFRVNGTTSYDGLGIPSGVTNTLVVTSTRAIVLAAGDWVEAMCLHVAGAALNVTLKEFFAMFITR